MKQFERLQQAVTSKEHLEQCFLHGLEREALRVNSDGSLAQTPHQPALGNKLAHPMITTDFAENQLELITPPYHVITDAVSHLDQLQAWVESHIGNELLWPLSMPPDISDPSKLQIARYGDSKEAQQKEMYRKGLAERYGSIMQAISGVHYNFSFQEFFWNAVCDDTDQKQRDDAYLGMVRNFLRYRFIPVYLFGASPMAGEGYDLGDACTLYAVSLRMSKYGYSNTVERNRILASFNSLEEFCTDMEYLLTTSDPSYEAIGLERNGEQIQLNTNILQIPDEYYGPVRLKPNAGGHSFTDALRHNGIQRIEVRALDLCPFMFTGVCKEEVHFLHLFLLYCFFHESPPLSDHERMCANKAQIAVSLYGRDPNLRIECDGKQVTVQEKCRTVFEELHAIAQWMDAVRGTDCYEACIAKFDDVVISGDIDAKKMVETMRSEHHSHHAYGLELAIENRKKIMEVEISYALAKELESYAHT